MLDDAEALLQWSRWHDGYDARGSRLTRGWVLGAHRVARPLAGAGVGASAVTAVGAVAAVAAVACASNRPRAAAALVLAAAGCDGLDGAVALQRGTASPSGTAIDHAADRVGDVAFTAALCRAGATARTGVAAALSVAGYEAVRDLLRSRNRAPAVVTVADRPLRVAVVVAGLATAPPVAAVVLVLMTAAGMLQLWAAARDAS